MPPSADRFLRTVRQRASIGHAVASSLDEVVRSSRALARAGSASSSFLAIVHTVDDIRFSVAAGCREELLERLATYVSASLGDQLWPADASHVRLLLERGELDAAIAAYFAAVGPRWDEEWLITTRVDASEG